MKIELVRSKQQPQEPKYPCLMESENGTVWLVVEHGKGISVRVVPSPTYDPYIVGTFAENLIMSALKPFFGTVTFTS